ncbi:pyridoxal-dependent decarboxylase, exosortase A system-associated [Sphingomonas flavescens]|uniref:pyridoxal-dependent decarboxylase, exosortase A system-associated n=1 Tax=Sphingomonas flavescens TaxID=3132797 RepID=UPI00280641E1|nr:pyridoxal-dependent decarboxylase, exosortase A system-associated [Sphingomonas limnosediminicola]
MKPVGPIPPYFEARDDGQLMIGGIAADELIEEAGGTPLFVYDNNIVGAQVARFKGAMADGIALHYSVTANPYEPLLEFLGRYVDGFRIVSKGELRRLQDAKLAGIPINFAGPGKLSEELEAAVIAGATISVESEGEAERAIRAAERVGIQPRISVRVTPPYSIEAGAVTLVCEASPFGVDAERVPSLVQGLLEADVDWRGLHMFGGAQCLDADALSEIHRLTVGQAGEIADAIGLPLPELNLGSGFDIACRPGDEPLDIDRVAAALNHTLCNAPPLLATTRFTIELGRWLVGESGVYLTRVVDRTESCGHTFLTTDGGGHHLIGATGSLGERGMANFPIAVANRFDAEPEESVTVAGCLCTPFDVLGDNVSLPRADVGDVIAVFCAGAYGLSASPQGWESRPLAREILV